MSTEASSRFWIIDMCSDHLTFL